MKLWQRLALLWHPALRLPSTPALTAFILSSQTPRQAKLFKTSCQHVTCAVFQWSSHPSIIMLLIFWLSCNSLAFLSFSKQAAGAQACLALALGSLHSSARLHSWAVGSRNALRAGAAQQCQAAGTAKAAPRTAGAQVQ